MILIILAYFIWIMYSINYERGVCFRTALWESLCGSLFLFSIRVSNLNETIYTAQGTEYTLCVESK